MEWVSVKDKLPDEGLKVLVYKKEQEEVSIGFYDPTTRATQWRCEEFMEIEVTHWMPLPEKSMD